MENDRMLIDKLRQEVLSGKLTYDDVVRRLTIAIETEYLKESPNLELIDSCEDFLWEIETEGKQKFVSVCDRYLNAIGQHSEVTTPKKTRTGPIMGFAKRIALISAAFAVLIFFTQGAMRFRWFSHNSSSDEQQYIIQGHDIGIDIISKSIAEHDEFDMLQTKDWNEFIDYLGFTPSIINPDMLEASNTQYIAFIEPGVIMLYIQYSGLSNDNEVLMTIQYFTDMEDAYFTLEQDAEGEIVYVHDTMVYVSTNVTNHSFTWLSGETIYRVAGSLTYEEGLQIVSEVVGGIDFED